MCKKDNLLISGACGVPGTVKGRIFIWGECSLSEFKREDIILILSEYSTEIPLSYISVAGGVISCQHTLYSHLVSATMAFNIPCIVGAIFYAQPKKFQYIFMDTISKTVTLDGKIDLNSYISKNNKILQKIASAIINSDTKMPLAHLYSTDELEAYKKYISGFFVDANTIQSLDDGSLKCAVKNISNFCHQTNTNVYYRFSKNPAHSSNSVITKELNFVHEILNEGVNLSLFFPNAENYNDILEFRKFVTLKYSDFFPFKIGSMIESKNLVKDLERIMQDEILDFAIIGMNDLLSSILELERDDEKNGLAFSIANPKVNNMIKLIAKKCKAYKIPFFISFPKFDNFVEDYISLREAGYDQFFGSLSLFKILKAYGEWGA